MPDDATNQLEGYDLSKAYKPARPELVNAVIHHESSGDPNAVSSTGATGLMQIEPSVAKDYGIDPEKLKDPEINRRLGTRYLSDLIARSGGDERKALISYNQGPNRKGMAPGVADYADRVLKTAGAPPVADPLEGYDLSKAYDPAHGKPNPMLDTGATTEAGQASEASAATARMIKQHEQTVAGFAAPIAAMTVTEGLAAPYIGGIGFEGYPAISRLVRAGLKAGSAVAGMQGGTAAVTGEVPTIPDSAKQLGLFTALGLTGELPGMLLSSASKSPAVMAALEKARLAAAKVGPRTANVADKVVDFFKAISPEMTPAQLAEARQSADVGNNIAQKVNSVGTYQGKKLQTGLRDNLGNLLDSRVNRSEVEDPINQALTNKPYLKQGLSPRMQSIVSSFKPAEQAPAGAADVLQAGKPTESMMAKSVQRYRDAGMTDDVIRIELRKSGLKPVEIKSVMGKGPASDNFFTQPDYSVDELTQLNSKIRGAVHTGSIHENYDKDFANYVSDSLKSTMHDQLATAGATTEQHAQFDQFFKDWAAHKQLQDAMEMAATGTIGIEQADRVWKIASDTSDKNGAEKFGQFFKLAQELDSSNPKSNVVPTLREAFNLRLSKAYSLGDTPEAARKAVQDAISAVPMETRMAVFGRGSPMVDAQRASELLGHLDNTAETEQAKATGTKLATAGRAVSPYIKSMLVFAGLKAASGSRDKRGLFQTLTHPKPEDIAMVATAVAIGFRGPQMLRAVMSYGSVPVQKAYAYMIEHPGDPKALETFARVLQVGIGAGQGAVAGGQSGHPLLGAAVGAALSAQGMGAEGTIEGSEAPRGMAPPAAPEPQNPNGPGPSNQNLANRVQGFKRVGDPQTGTPPAEPTPQLPVSNPPQLPAVRPQDDPMEALKWLKAKTTPVPKINLRQPAPLRDGSAVALPGGQAGPEGAGQFVTRGAPVTGTPPVERPATSPSSGATSPSIPETTPSLFGADHPRAEINTDFRKMKTDPNPTRFESPASTLGRNPDRWQFKESNKEGLTDALSGVRNYDPIQGGDLIAYYDPQSEKLEVIDGHQRHYLAQGDGDSKVPYFVLDGGNNFKGALAHGVSPEAARAYAAVRNLRAGTGSSLDVAKFVRDTGLKVEDLKELNVPLSGAQTKDGLALSNLDDNVFREVAGRRFPERMGIVLGQELPGNPVQTDILKQVRESEEKGKPVSPALLQEWIRQAKGSSGTQGNLDMFGKKASETNFKEMGQVSQFVRKELKTSKTAFNYTGKHADLLATGNTIVDKDTGTLMSKDAANRDMMFQRVGYERGSNTHRIIDETATALKGAKSRGQESRLLRDAYKEIQKVLPEDFDKAVTAARNPG